ncbi:MAG TPA: ABC transporter permease [Beutenbergiaceae bacterium]|nr:ABC transporter permease [Beutenbergiaceae bacterium]
MNTPRMIALIAGREVRTRLLAKATVVSTLIMVVAIVAAIIVASVLVGRDDAEATRVGIAPETADLAPALEQAALQSGINLEIEQTDADEGTNAVLEGDLAAYISGEPTAPVLGIDGTPDPMLMSAVTTATQQTAIAEVVTELGGDPEDVDQQLAAAVPSVQLLDDDDGGFDPMAFIVAIATTSLLLFALLQIGSLIAMGVVEEKVSRVVEILLATVRPSVLMAGKVIGIGLVGLTQIALFVGSALVTVTATGLLADVELDLGAALVWLFVWFFLGFALYSVIFGGLAALVSRQEDIGSVTTPMIFLMMAPFYLGIFLVPNNPESSVAAWLSQVPFFSPFIMPVRQAFGAVTGAEVALSIGLCLVFIPLLVWIGGRIYSRGVLRTGGRMKLTEALKKN